MSKHAVVIAKPVLSEEAQQAAHHSAEAEKHRICGNSEKAAYHAYLAQYWGAHGGGPMERGRAQFGKTSERL